MRPLLLGVIGCGAVACEVHARAWKRFPGIRIAAVTDQEEARARSLAGRFSAEVFSSWEDVVALPGLDAIALLTPPSLRSAPILAALQCGKAVFVEKPLALDLAECRHIGEAVDQGGGRLMLGFNLRWHPHIREARRWIAGATKPFRMLSRFTVEPPRDAWRNSSHPAASVFFELATHHFDLFEFLTADRITAIQTTTGNIIRARSALGHQAEIHVGYTSAPQHGLRLDSAGSRFSANFYNPFPALDGPRQNAFASWPAKFRCLPQVLAHAGRGGIFHSSYLEQWKAFRRYALKGAVCGVPDWRAGARATEFAQTARAQMEETSLIGL